MAGLFESGLQGRDSASRHGRYYPFSILCTRATIDKPRRPSCASFTRRRKVPFSNEHGTMLAELHKLVMSMSESDILADDFSLLLARIP